MIKTAFDPLSTRQNVLALAFVDELRKYEVRQLEVFKTLLSAFVERFEQAGEAIKARGRLDSSRVTPAVAQKATAFQARNVWAGIKVCLSVFHDSLCLRLNPCLSLTSSLLY